MSRHRKATSTTQEENQMSEELQNVESTETESNGEATTSKRARKLEKDLASQPGKVVITVLDGKMGAMVFDPNDLPEDIKQKLIPFGLGHKLGDAAAGKSGEDAEDAIQKVFEGLKTNDWTVRAPAAPKVSIKDVAQNFANLSDEEKRAAAPLLKAMGLNIPGITDLA